jgi:hypothetical protein
MRKLKALTAILAALSISIFVLGSCASAAKPDGATETSKSKSGGTFLPGTKDAPLGEAAKPEAAPSPAEPGSSKEMEAPPSASFAAKTAEGFGRADAPSPSAAYAPPSASGLKAGFSDDNVQFNYFLGFLDEYKGVPNYAIDIGERITLKVADSAGRSVPNARVRVRAGTRNVEEGVTYADGTFRLYPLVYDTTAASFAVRIESAAGNMELEVLRDGPRQIDVRLASPRAVSSPLPLDILFVMDTTGSMGEEIERLRDTIEIVHANISALTPRPAVRFGMVLYKDREDEYVTQVVPFTADLPTFQKALDEVYADGGGDTPEDLQAALEDSIKKMDWNKGGIRMGFIVTDAQAHLDYGQKYTYAHAARDAKDHAIKLHTIGTGGLGIDGEYVLRQISQYTEGKYIFLTYGETGEAEGGAPGAVSHHTGANFQTDKLEAIVIRFVKEELSHLSDTPLEAGEDYFEAQKVADETRESILDKLFGEALANLVDYSTYKVGPDTPCAILPIVPSQADLSSNAEYFGERLLLTAAASKPFKIVERKSLQSVLDEMELQLSGLADERTAAKAGELLGADVLVTGTLYRKDGRYELFLRLVRTSTAEVLAVTRARVDAKLGL